MCVYAYINTFIHTITCTVCVCVCVCVYTYSNSGYGDSVSEERAAANLATAAQQGPAWRCNNVLVPMQDSHNHDSFSSPTYEF